MRVVLVVFFIFFIFGYGSNISNYPKGLAYYQNKQYQEAYPIILQEAQKGNKEAQYLLANLYENGDGVQKDIEQSLYWYKKASSTYAYVTKKVTVDKTGKNLEEQTQTRNFDEQKGLQYIFSKMDLSSPNVKNELDKIVNKDFGILPYSANYILPFSHSTKRYIKEYSATQNSDRYYENKTEAEFQLSLQKNLSFNLFGLNEYISLGYTQHVWWQLYSDSAPFRETNYTPEVFVTIPTPYEFGRLSNLKAIKFGYRHQSNGQDGYRSRSWDRLFLATYWQWDNLFLKVEGWTRIPEKRKSDSFYNGTNINADGDDNPDILNYYGYGDVQINYLYKEHQLGLMLRNNFNTNRGALELNWTHPMSESKNTYWYLKVFNGYGESLIDYDNRNTKIGFGVSFFRSLF